MVQQGVLEGCGIRVAEDSEAHLGLFETAVALIALGISLPEHLPSLLGGLRADVRNALVRPYFHIGELPITPVFLVKAFVFLLLLSIVTGAIRRFELHRALTRTSLDEGQRYAFPHIIGYVVCLVGLLVGLELLGLDLSNLVLLGSAIGIGLEWPEILFKGFGESSLDFNLRVWTTARVQTPLPLASELYFSIFRAFKENGIEIPFPHRDLHLKTVSASVRNACDGGEKPAPSSDEGKA